LEVAGLVEQRLERPEQEAQDHPAQIQFLAQLHLLVAEAEEIGKLLLV
jgi:hypothetical protein